MARRRRRRSRRRSTLRTYVLVTVACAVLAVLAHFMFEAPQAVREYAEGELNEAVRSAVRQEVRSAAAEQQQAPPLPAGR